MIPEFVGRVPVIASLNQLDIPALTKVLTEPKNALIKQYKELMKFDGVELIFEEDAIEAIAEAAFKRKMGARALRSIVEEIMLDIMYEAPKNKKLKKCIVTKEMVENKSSADVLHLTKPKTEIA